MGCGLCKSNNSSNSPEKIYLKQEMYKDLNGGKEPKIKSNYPVKINQRWEMYIDLYVGKGAFGLVYKGQNLQTGEIVAIKNMKIEPLMFQSEPELEKMFNQGTVVREIQILRDLSNLNHDNIVKFIDFHSDKPNIYIVVELCDESLKDYIGRKGGSLTEKEAQQVGFQILRGLSVLHERGISHRDMKSDNILVKDGVFKINDFGMSIDKDRHSTTVGFYWHRAPECVTKVSRNVSVDIWAFGVMMHQMVFKNLPFQNGTKGFEHAIQHEPYEVPKSPTTSDGFQDMLKKCFEKDPAKRITSKQLLQHPFFSGLKFEKPTPLYVQAPKVYKAPQAQEELSQNTKKEFEIIRKLNPSGSEQHAPKDRKKAEKMYEPGVGQKKLYEKLGQYKPRNPDKQFEDLPYFGPFLYNDYGGDQTYTGQYKDGKRHGFGIRIWNGGSIYEGYWENDKAHGEGREIYCMFDLNQPSETVYCWYEGRCENECANGFGIETGENGYCYKGLLKDGKRHGKGEEKLGEGVLVNEHQMNEGDLFVGEFENDNKKEGTYTWKNGDSFIGPCNKEGKLDGKGFYTVNGIRKLAVFVDGKFFKYEE